MVLRALTGIGWGISMTAAMTICSVLAPVTRLAKSMGIISVNLFVISQVQSLWLLTLTGFVGGFGQGFIFPALSTYVIDIFGRENKGLAIEQA